MQGLASSFLWEGNHCLRMSSGVMLQLLLISVKLSESADRFSQPAQLRIHRKLKEAAVFRYSRRVSKEDGSVRIIFYANSEIIFALTFVL